MYNRRQILTGMGLMTVFLQKIGLCKEMNQKEIMKLLKQIDQGRDYLGIFKTIEKGK